MSENNKQTASATASLVKFYRQAEDFTQMGLFVDTELGLMLFELLDRVGESQLRHIVSESCPEIPWKAARSAMDKFLGAGPDVSEFCEASPWRDSLDDPLTFASWLTYHYQESQFLHNWGLLRRLELGDRLLELMHRVGKVQLGGILAPGIPWKAAELAMTFALTCRDREVLYALRRHNFPEVERPG
jgi:hypothetical protein